MKITRFGAAAVSTAALLALAACGDNTQTPATDAAPADDMAMAPATTDPMVGGAAMSPNDNIVANASKASNLTTLVSAVQAAGLVETLQGPGPFTVFAPDNGAFEKIPADTREGLMQPAQRDALRGILTYHVVPGRLTAADIAAQAQANNGVATLTTVQGDTLTVRDAGGGRWTITDGAGGTSTITQADVGQSNGVVHVIDTVLMPA
ncbi:fasciclin domain-containing protein [Brevundimonas sp. S30B]|uniref:fasciclin domain-containing protein n=1 Tax=unclassified Brevundimonas TaxID=2622653 RepID=UPI0010727D9C|nr:MULTISPECIES: fasciclin domain-containing protein [unclassified Brevundimonas]QBX36360.1 fasciclin domain-containing protein [Brevundimonas sp. MF30-B]TFW01069.1 fasciclin domain-containing protein [Brevundimonas sp. S30B]